VLDHATRIAAAYYRSQDGREGWIRPDFADAYCRHLREMSTIYDWMIRGDAAFNAGANTLFQMAAHDLHEEFCRRFFYKLRGEEVGTLEPDVPAQQATVRWLNEQSRIVSAMALPDCPDFPVAPRRFDATDKSLRQRSTDFGNAIADSIELATGADLALVNAGSFRIDDKIGPRIDVQTLREVFLHDSPAAVSLITLTAAEVRDCYRHAQTRHGLGGFLQVSRTLEWVQSRPQESFSVAMVTFLLSHRQDGYQEILARARGCAVEALVEQLRVPTVPQRRLIELVISGVARGTVNYSDDIRLTAFAKETDRATTLSAQLIGAIDAYIAEYTAASLDLQAARALLVGNEDFHDEIHAADAGERGIDLSRVKQHLPMLFGHVKAIGTIVVQMWRECGGMRGLGLIYEKLATSRETYEQHIRYQDYLDSAMQPLDVWVRREIARLETPH